MLQHAKVTKILNEATAKVSVVRESACGHDCASCGGCGMASAPVVADAENCIGARVGDSVIIETDTTAVIGIAAVVYLFPLVLFFALYILCRAFNAVEFVSVAAGAFGFAVGILCAVALNRNVAKKKKVSFKIVSFDLGDS